MSDSPAMIARTAGRMLVLDPDKRVLLLEHRTGPDSDETVWAAPGGGCEPGESPVQAARRELGEECGFSLAPVSEAPVLIERRDWSLAGIAYDQTDHFFLAHADRQPPVLDVHRTEWEAHAVLGHRWFSAEELLASPVRIEPAGLAELLAALR
jgi:8-oxo-dGTP pyrophosphatase MutT (NUDIX family)